MAPDPLPSVAALAVLDALATRGACLTMPEPGLLVIRPADAAGPEELEALRAARSWLLAAWQAAAAWDSNNPPRPDLDPLPPAPLADADDLADADAWADLLTLAAPIDGADPFGLTGRLRFARSLGARLRWTDAGALTLRMPAGHPESAAVGTALAGQGERLRRLLRLAADAIAPERRARDSSSNGRDKAAA